MTSDQILSDLYMRLSSRKLWLALLSIGFAFWSYHLGDLTAQQFQQAVLIAVGTYTAAEGASDALAAWRPNPRSPDAVVTTNVDTTAPPAATAATRAPARRVRPSRAKPKPAGAKS